MGPEIASQAAKDIVSYRKLDKLFNQRVGFYNNLSLFVFKFDRCLNKVRQDTIFSFPLDDRILCVVKLT